MSVSVQLCSSDAVRVEFMCTEPWGEREVRDDFFTWRLLIIVLLARVHISIKSAVDKCNKTTIVLKSSHDYQRYFITKIFARRLCFPALFKFEPILLYSMCPRHFSIDNIAREVGLYWVERIDMI